MENYEDYRYSHPRLPTQFNDGAQDQLKGEKSELEFLVIRIVTDENIEGHSFGFAGRGAKMAGQIAATSVKPWLLGKDPLYREAWWHESRVQDRWWGHTPIYTYGPFDIALWDIAAKKAELPLYKLLGAYRDKVPAYASSLLHPTPEDYAKEAVACKERGLHGYKLHPPGDYDFDLAAYKACRQAVGDDFILMADPVAAYNHQQALRMGRELEKLNYYWLEEPLYDVDFYGLQKLTAKLDIPICGTEVMAGQSLFGRALHSRRDCGYGADGCVVEGWGNGRYENCSFGRILWHTVRTPHHHLPSAGTGQSALRLCHEKLRIL